MSVSLFPGEGSGVKLLPVDQLMNSSPAGITLCQCYVYGTKKTSSFPRRPWCEPSIITVQLLYLPRVMLDRGWHYAIKEHGTEAIAHPISYADFSLHN
jgi:hypothetical protein